MTIPAWLVADDSWIEDAWKKNSLRKSLVRYELTFFIRNSEKILELGFQLSRGEKVSSVLYYLTEVSKTRQYRVPPFLLANRTFPAGFP